MHIFPSGSVRHHNSTLHLCKVGQSMSSQFPEEQSESKQVFQSFPNSLLVWDE